MNQFEKAFDYIGNNVRTFMRDEVSKVYLIDSLGRNQQTSVVSEAGLYCLILTSNKPEAKQFKRWVTHDVLPAIRKNGMYISEDATREQKLFNYDLLEETFRNCGIGMMKKIENMLQERGLNLGKMRLRDAKTN